MFQNKFVMVLGVPGRYNSQSRTLTLSDANALGTISHERFHAFQHENDALFYETETEAAAFLFSTVVGVQAGFSGWYDYEHTFMIDYGRGTFNFHEYNNMILNFHQHHREPEYRELWIPWINYNRDRLPLIYNVIMR